MKQILLALLFVAAFCSISVAQENNTSRPFVEEGKTWWYCAGHTLTKEQISNMQDLDHGHFEYGFSIGSKVTIDGKEWNKIYMKMRYTNVPNPDDPEDYNSIKVYDEDAINCGYIREEDGKVYTYEAGVGNGGFTYYEFGFAPRWTYGSDVPIYDFSNNVQSFAFGTERNIVFNLENKNIIENHNNTFNDYTFTSEFLNNYNEDKTIHFVESVGVLPFESVFFRNLFFMPLAETLTKGGSGMHYLTYVTDAQNNIIFEDAGGRKLWEFYNGVEDILMDTDENEAIEWYNINGIKIPQPTESGIYIRRQGKSAQKILIK